MSEELPEGWARTTLSVLLAEPLANGRSVPDGGGFPVLRLTALKGGTVDLRERKRGNWSKTEGIRFAVKRGDFLVARGSGSLALVGRGALVIDEPDPVAYPDTAIRVRPNPSVLDSLYLRRAWESAVVRGQIEQMARTTAGIHKVSQGDLGAVSIPLPPLAEQRRIVAKVEELLAEVDAAKARLSKVPAILKRFRQSVLAAACAGKLTEDWRAAREADDSARELVADFRAQHATRGPARKNAAPPSDEAHDLVADDFPESWALTELEWLCEPGRPITYGILKPGPHIEDGVPYVRVADFPVDTIRLDGVRRTTPEIAAEFRRATLRTGDVLLSIRGTYGRVCRVPVELDGANITQDTARLSITSSISADYVATCLRSPGAQDRMKRSAKGVAVHGVNIGDVRALQVPVPPVAEQREIVARVNVLLALADSVGTQVEASASRARRLAQSVLAKAFRGELVPTEAELARAEGRDYETAEQLLARTRAEAGSAVRTKGGDAVRPRRRTRRA